MRKMNMFIIVGIVMSTLLFGITSALPNPASVYCEEQGGISGIRTNSDGSQIGYCTFSDGTECEEWAYYRGECSQTEVSNENPGLNNVLFKVGDFEVTILILLIIVGILGLLLIKRK